MDYSNEEIKRKYLKAPTFEEISEVIKELGVTYAQFERYFSMFEGVIRHIKKGTHKLPVKHWPIIYDRVGIPNYAQKKVIKIDLKKPVSKITTLNTHHSRLKDIG